METSIYDIMHKAMWTIYDRIKESNYEMGGMETDMRIQILENYLLPYFIEYEEFEICDELNKNIIKLKNE